jgi:hypothetical protein
MEDEVVNFFVTLILAVVTAFGPPIHGPVVLGPTHPVDGYHTWPAIDFRVPVGTPVRAVADGTIEAIGEVTDADETERRPGRWTLLELTDPAGDCQFVAYKHLSDWVSVAGDQVTEGQIIALSGSTQAPRPHLHLDCFTDADQFQNFDAQAGFRMEWCSAGKPRSGTPESLDEGDELRLWPRTPCRP